jgi:hypothetical protein
LPGPAPVLMPPVAPPPSGGPCPHGRRSGAPPRGGRCPQ